MARTIKEIYDAIISDIAANATLNQGLNSTSKTAQYRLYAYIIASAIWVLEKIFDTHKTEVETTIANLKPHSLLWYQNKALAFQLGVSLVGDTDEYAAVDEAALIIKYAAAKEGIDGFLKVKVAKAGTNELDYLSGAWPNNGVSAPMTPLSGGSGERLAFYTYMENVKDAGVKIRYISQEADHLRSVIDIYYNPLVLSETGERIDGTDNTPVQTAIANYLQNLPFNGEFSIMAYTDAIQLVDGVDIVQPISCETYWGAYAWAVISAKYTPEAGWLKIYGTDLTINWIASE
jgi:hypothetical protein